jgi:hypothetical protein
MTAVLVLCTLLQARVGAQEDDPLETLRRVPPNSGMLDKRTIELGKAMLEWQIRRGTVNLQRLDAEIRQLEQQITEMEAASASIAEKSQLEELAFATDAVRDQLLARVLGRLLEARVDIAANEAMAQHLDDQLKNVSPDEGAQERHNAQRDALQKKLSLLSASAERIKSVFKGAGGPPIERQILESQIKVLDVEAEIAKLAADEEASGRRRAAEVASSLADVRVELHQLRVREGVSELQLKELAADADAARKRREIQREVDRLSARLEVRTRRYEEISMEVEEAKLLLREIVAATADGGKQPTSGNP